MSNFDIVIRKAQLSDCEDICLIENTCFSDPWSKQSFEYQLSSNSGDILVAVVDGKIAGFINLSCVVGELTINNIAVLKEYRKQGIADRLLANALDKYSGSDVAFLEVRESNIPAQSLYRKHGFFKFCERKNYYRNPTENAWLMTKDMKNGY